MLTTEKLILTSISRIEKILIDLRTYMATEFENTLPSTPNYTNIDVNIVDLNQTATPNY